MSFGGRNRTNKYTESFMEEGKPPRAQEPGQGPEPSEKGQSKAGAHVSSSTYLKSRVQGFEANILRHPVTQGCAEREESRREGATE